MKRTTMVIGSLGAGGAERVAVRLANFWAGRRRMVTLIALDDQTGRFTIDERVQVKRLAVTGASGSIVSALRNNSGRIAALRRAIVASEPDQVISMLTETNILTLLATVGLGLPVVVSERSNPAIYPYSRAWRMMRPLMYRLAYRVVAQTEESARWFSSFPVVVIPNPAPTLTAPLNAGGRERLVVGLGRLGPEKGYTRLISAFAAAHGRHPGWRLEIHGEGAEQEALQRQIEGLGMTQAITLPGVSDDVEGVLKRAGIFVLTSDFEGFPNALCEAMTCGAAVVSFDCDYGPRELIDHEKNGLLVPPGADEMLTIAMERLMDDDEFRLRLGSAAMQVGERYSIEAVAEQWEKLWP